MTHPVSPNAARPDLIAEAYHGTITNYGYGCRCDDCRSAHVADSNARRRSHRGLPNDDPRHGTLNGYQNWRCSCDACSAANAAATARGKARRAGTLTTDDPRHGTHGAYNNYDCRCDRCRSAARAYHRQRRAAS